MAQLFNPFFVSITYQPKEEVLECYFTFGDIEEGNGPPSLDDGLNQEVGNWVEALFDQNTDFLANETVIIGYSLYGRLDEDQVPYRRALDVTGSGGSAMPSDSYAMISSAGNLPDGNRVISTVKMSGIPKDGIVNGSWLASYRNGFNEDNAPLFDATITTGGRTYARGVIGTYGETNLPHFTRLFGTNLRPIVGSMKERIPNRNNPRRRTPIV